MLYVIYGVLVWTVGIVFATRFHDASLLFRVTREDGLVEWLTVLALFYLSASVLFQLKALPKPRPKLALIPGLVLAFLSLVAAGEEISWGQRILGFETSESLKKINYQGESNLHNLIPAELFNGVIIFGVLITFTILPLIWRLRSQDRPWWLPSEELGLLTLAAASVNHYRVSSVGEKFGLLLLFSLLFIQTVRNLRLKNLRHLTACSLAILTSVSLWFCSSVLRAANFQYEIRELLVILLVALYCKRCSERIAAPCQEE